MTREELEIARALKKKEKRKRYRISKQNRENYFSNLPKSRAEMMVDDIVDSIPDDPDQQFMEIDCMEYQNYINYFNAQTFSDYDIM